MKVILLADIKGVGKKDQIISASDGYARNFLFPKKLAVEANNENLAKLKSKNESKAYKKEMDIKEAEEVKKKIDSITIKMTVTLTSKSATSKALTKLKAGKTYYVKVRAYKTVDGKKIYSSWSKVKSAKA